MAYLRRTLLVFLVLVPMLAFGQSADQEVVSVVDSPDPVTPGATLTYTITLTNHGPNAATNGGINVSLPLEVTYLSTIAPAGFTCGTFGSSVSCTTPSFAPGTVQFTMNVQVGAHLANFPDGQFSVTVSPSGTTADPNMGNNSKSATTSYDSPQIDLSVAVTDSPDPVAPNNNVTYTVNVTNAGPNTATNVNFNVFNNGSLRFQSAAVPAGWNCTLPAMNGIPNFTCTNASFAPSTSQFTIVLHADRSVIGINDTTLQTNFNVNGTGNETNNGNNSETESTAYVAPDADLTIAVTDAPDPVAPDGDITYTVTVTNVGPDTATDVNMNVYNNNTLRFRSITVPSGWSCPSLPAIDGHPSFTCTATSFASGATSVFTLVLRAYDEVLGINDTTVQTSFSVSALTTADPVPANNSEVESTAYTTTDADLAVTVTDAPDPVGPDGDVTYTATVTNNGPDTATSVNFNVYNNNTLRFRSITVPSGWSCPMLPAVDGHPSFTCTATSLASGATSVFTLVLRAYDEVVGINDTSVQTSFSVSSGVADPVPGNNSEIETTQYVAPDADLAVTVTDSPDPVTADGDITYTATVTNNGPDAATSVNFNVFNNNLLRFRSAVVPAGWNCTLPAVDGNPSFTCTIASFASGATSVFTVVLRAYDEVLGINDTTLQTSFSVGSGVADPIPANNTEVESTQYSTPDANVSITASDSPDPVTNGQNVTFTVTAVNAGPDTAPNAQVVLAPHPSLTFQSISPSAGWSCTTPAVDAAGVVTCTKSAMGSGEGAAFTLVTKLVTAGSGGTLQSTFGISSGAQDPVPANNNVTVDTNWIGQTSDLGIGKSTLSSAAAQGSTITYTISTINHGPDAASNVTVTDVLHPALRFQSITAPAGWSCTTPAVGANGTVTCSIATFPNGATGQFTLVVSVDPSATGTITNSASIGSSTTDPSPGNSSGASGSVAVAGNADLGVTKTTAATNAQRGGAVSYTITVSNAGPEAAASVVMTDVLPSSLLFQSIAAPAGWSCTTPAVGTSGTVTCNAATLAAGASAVFTLNTTVATNASGSIVNSASGSHSGTDANGGNSTGSTAPLPVAPGSADLAATKSTAVTTVAPGQTFSYTIAVTNNGPDAAANAVMTDTLPASLLFQSIAAPAGWNCTTPAVGATGTITCTAVSVASGTTANFTLTVQVASNATGTITNTAAVSSAETDPNPGNNNTTTAPVPVTPATSANISVTKTTTATNVTVGSTFTYTITVTNAGPAGATNVVVNDTLPSNLQFVSATPSQGTCNAASPVVCSLGTIGSGGNATVSLVVRALAAGAATNTASAVAAEDAGPNSGSAPEIIVVGGPGHPVAAIPTLSEWMLIALMLMIGAIAVIRMRT